MKSYVIHMLRAMPSQGVLEGRYVGRGQSPLALDAISRLTALKQEFVYPKAQLFCASPAIACVDTLKVLYPQAEPEVVLELAECDFGEWEGKTAQDLQGEKAARCFFSGFAKGSSCWWRT